MFSKAIEDIGHTLLVLCPWDPVPLTRAWCLWEILCSVESGAEFRVVLPPVQAKAFTEVLVEDFKSIAGALSRVDVAKSEAFEPRDQEMILSAVEDGVGFLELNQVVIGQLREWVAGEG